jgi:hypothetical protein
MIVWDERKRQTNLAKHGLDFADAYLVYDDPEKLTISYFRNNEHRLMDTAFVEIRGKVLALVYVVRDSDIRVISFRFASRLERKLYAEASRKQDRLGTSPKSL